MKKELRKQLVKKTADFMACSNEQANQYVAKWMAMAKTEVQTQEHQDTLKLINSIGKQARELRAIKNEEEGEKLLSDILVVASERTITKI